MQFSILFSCSCENALRWMLQDQIDHTSILVQAMAWCRQATRHYLSQCFPRSLSPYGVTRPKWVKFMSHVCETAFIWMQQSTFHDMSTLVQVIAWYHRASNHCLSQLGWHRFMSPNNWITEIRAWINKYVHDFLYDVIIHSFTNFIYGLVTAWISNFIND